MGGKPGNEDHGLNEGRLGPRIAGLLETRPEILEAYLFGSHARGGAQPHSDIDVAVYIDEAHRDRSAFGLRAELSTLLMEGLRDNGVDLLILNDAPPVLYYHVLRDGVRVLSRDLAMTTTREGQAVSRYCDFVPQLRKMEAARSFARRQNEMKSSIKSVLRKPKTTLSGKVRFR